VYLVGFIIRKLHSCVVQ